MYDYYLGIDISKDTFNVSLINYNEDIEYEDKLDMSYKDFDKLKNAIQNYGKDKIIICIEATGIYHVNLLFSLLQHNCNISLVNPMLIKSFSKSISLRNTKTDKVDAFTISKFAKYYYQSLKLTKLEDINSIKTLAREKETIEDSIVKLKNQMNSLMTQLFPELIRKVNIFTDTMLNILLKMPSTSSILNASNKDIDNIIDSSVGNKIKISSKELKRLANCSIGISDENLSLVLQSKIRRLFFLKDELLSLDALINKNINNNDKLNSSIEILKSIDGIGDKTSKDFMIEVGDINRFDNSKKLTAYIGTDPSIKQSGTSLYIQGKISKKGNSHLRKTIYKMAISVCFHNISFKRYYQKKRKEGKSYKQSLIAVANKLIRLIYSMLINRTMYNKNKYYFYPVLT